MFQEFLSNFAHNLFKPLLLFFYAGFLVPLLGVKFEFPKVIYQGLTIFLLLAIGWHGGEELAGLEPSQYGQAAGFMVLGFFTNLVIGIVTYGVLRSTTRLRKIDAATVSGYYGSDSAGTFVTCLGVLTAAHIAFAPYMPVMLAVMEIPGCLVALFLVSRLRRQGMDTQGNMPGEPGYMTAPNLARRRRLARTASEFDSEESEFDGEEALVSVGAEEYHESSNGHSTAGVIHGRSSHGTHTRRHDGGGHSGGDESGKEGHDSELQDVAEIALESLRPEELAARPAPAKGFLNKELLHEVFLNPGIFLLFGGIVIGFISRLQGESITKSGSALFVNMFQGILCLFLLEMGMTAARKLKDLRAAGWRFAAFAILAPNLFAVTGMSLAHVYSYLLGQPFELGTYALFAVLCGAASYIALPAVQRMAIPEASPTLPLAASLGLTFSYNVTIGIPVYILYATMLTKYLPVMA